MFCNFGIPEVISKNALIYLLFISVLTDEKKTANPMIFNIADIASFTPSVIAVPKLQYDLFS